MEAFEAFLGSSVFTNLLLFLILISGTSYLRSIQSMIYRQHHGESQDDE